MLNRKQRSDFYTISLKVNTLSGIPDNQVNLLKKYNLPETAVDPNF